MKNKENLRIYKEFLPDGNFAYATKNSDSRGCISELSLKGIAERVYRNHQKLKAVTQITIDFVPYHNMELPSGLAPRKCLPLSKKEIDEFWKHYVSLVK